MSLFNIIGSVLIGPLKLVFEVIFSVAYDVIQHPGLAIIALSLMMNVLVLPLYRRADAIQMEARDTENRLKDTIAHIKKTFSGDERMMILQTFYRQNNYSPLSVLSSSISLLLQIPFFMAAYQFLSGVEAFQGVSFGPIADLSVPDGMLVIGGITINVLPVIMTLVNVISSSLYLKGFSLKNKIQLYGMALFFLVFLYNSPAALVFYWTLNNVFSLVKTLFYRMKNAKTVLNVLLAVVGAASFVLGIWIDGVWRSSFLLLVGIAMQLPWAMPLLKKHLPFATKANPNPPKPNTAMFVCGALFLTVLVGLLIPSTYVAASPQEYIDTHYFYNPVWYVVQTLCYAAGLFMVWLGVFYWLANAKGKVIFSRLVWALSGITLINYMFFGTKLGIVSADLQFENGLDFALLEQLINIAVVVVAVALLIFLAVKFARGLTAILLTGAIALASMGTINMVKIANTAAETKVQIESSAAAIPSFSLSKEGQNVVVIMLDRGVGSFIPYIMEENPTLVQQFDGFVNYSNTLSYGGFTNFGTPALYGGYDYTPVEMNLRDTESLKDKHNEALKVMPTLFANADYDVTVIDPSYANYQWTPDLSIYNSIDGVTAYHAEGMFNNQDQRVNTVNNRKRNFFFFSLMKTLPVSLQSPLYNNGTYRAVPTKQNDTTGVLQSFMSAYNTMKNLGTMTTVTNGNDNTFMFLRSNITHNPVVLQEPSFTPSSTVDNSAYYPAEGKTITAGDSSYLLKGDYVISHYHANMTSLMQLGNWFDELRAQGVYDNTRIIVVSDHGQSLGVFSTAQSKMHNTEFYMPMLMVKDFNATGFTTSEEFMTNGDVPTLALEGLIENPVNPFTGNAINSDRKEGEQYVILSDAWDVAKNNGNQFLPAEWASVSDSVHNADNWTIYPGAATFPPTVSP